MEYKKIQLKELIDYANTGADAIQRAPIVEYDTGVRCIRIGDISNNRKYEEWGFTEISKENYNKYKLDVGDILIARTGSTIGISKIIKKEINGVYNNGLIKVKVNKDKCDSNYFYYILQSKDFINYIQGIAFGTTGQPNMKINDFLKFEINDISIEKQNKIANILLKIDEKIDLNNQINDNLFELLKIEFKTKFYNKNSDAKLSDYISNTIGGDWGKELPVDNYNTKVYCVRGADIPNMEYGNKGNAPTRYILEKNYNNKKLKPNNIIIEISGGSPTQSTGRTAYITENILSMYDAPLLCTNFCRAIETKKDIYAPFVYMYLTLMYEEDIFFNWENGTTGIKNLALNDLLLNIEITQPNEDELNNYYILFNNIMNKISNNSNENIKLEQLRDTLLPKLMNGEIDLEKINLEEI